MLVGIDLGTTNSLIAYWDGKSAQIIPNSLGKVLTPSVVSFNDDEVLVGEPALNRMVTHPALTVCNFKRAMGSNQSFMLGNKSFRAEELSSFILKRLKEDAEAFLGTEAKEAIISVPAYFSDAQRKATKIAGRLAGLIVDRIINEPTAAGIAYGLKEQEDESSYLIFDLGGGTFDVSIISLFSGIIEVRASSGDNYLGGIDFTSVLAKIFTDYLSTQFIKDIPLQLQAKIQEQAEIAKRQLSINPNFTMKIHWDSHDYTFDINTKDFEKGAEILLKRLEAPILKTLNDAKLTKSQIEHVVLVGGASKMPLAKKTVTRLFGRLPLCHIDPDTVVALGCAIQAGLKTNHAALNEIVVTDVSPYSLGVATHNPLRNEMGCFQPIIERNTVVPTSKSEICFPIHPEQKYVDIRIFQGESFFLEKNIFLGNLLVEIPPNITDKRFELRFTYDINGILEVEVTFLENQQKKSLIIEGNPGVMNEDEIIKRLEALKDLKIHPRDKTENLVVMTQAEKLYEELRGEDRLMLAELLKQFMLSLEQQDAEKIISLRSKLVDVFKLLQPNYI